MPAYYLLLRENKYFILFRVLLRGGIAQCVQCTATIYDVLCVLVSVLIIPDSVDRAVWQLSAEIPSSKKGESWREMTVNFSYDVVYLFSYLWDPLTCRKIL
jgi:hypothetical protein